MLATLVGCSSGDGSPPGTSTSTPTRGGTSTPTAPGTSAVPGTSAHPTVDPGPAGGPVPDGFTAASVTFVSLQTGWVLGTAPCVSPPCTSLLRTRDGGRTWAGIPAPRAELSGDLLSDGVHRVRFADTDNGWAFGPDLWSTHDGGAHWSQVILAGAGDGSTVSTVSALEAAAGKVHAAVISHSSGTVSVLTSPVDADDWQLSPTSVSTGAGPVPFAQVVLQGDRGWLVEVDRVVIDGARLSDGSWVPWEPPCFDAGGRAVLAASTPGDLVAICNEGEWNDLPRATRAYVSGDAGTTFSQVGVPVPLRSAVAVAAASPDTYVAAGDNGLVATFDRGATWSSVEGGAGERWNEVGFTSPTQGVAIRVTGAGDAAIGSLLMTVDGGHTWNVVPLR